MATPWIDLLEESLEAEYHGKPAVAALATAGKKSVPHVRFIVCRKVETDGSLWFVSDHRSGKNEQLRTHPTAEAAFWLPTLRQQFRLHGNVETIGDGQADPRRHEAWTNLSDASRGLFRWPAPAAPFDIGAQFNRAIPAIAPMPEDFELLILQPDQVEHLDINPHPHQRRRWRVANDWAEEELNP